MTTAQSSPLGVGFMTTAQSSPLGVGFMTTAQSSPLGVGFMTIISLPVHLVFTANSVVKLQSPKCTWRTN